jgi:hypothetical protein
MRPVCSRPALGTLAWAQDKPQSTGGICCERDGRWSGYSGREQQTLDTQQVPYLSSRSGVIDSYNLHQSFTSALFTRCGQIMEDEMGRVGSTHGIQEMHTDF